MSMESNTQQISENIPDPVNQYEHQMENMTYAEEVLDDYEEDQQKIVEDVFKWNPSIREDFEIDGENRIHKYTIAELKLLVKKLLDPVTSAAEAKEKLLSMESGEDIISYCSSKKVIVEAFNFIREEFMIPTKNGAKFDRNSYILFIKEFVPLLWVVHEGKIYTYNPKGGLIRIDSASQGASLLTPFINLVVPKDVNQIANVYCNNPNILFEIEEPIAFPPAYLFSDGYILDMETHEFSKSLESKRRILTPLPYIIEKKPKRIHIIHQYNDGEYTPEIKVDSDPEYETAIKQFFGFFTSRREALDFLCLIYTIISGECSSKERLMIIIQGRKRSGKSTMATCLRNMLGDASCGVQFEVLCEGIKADAGPSPYLMKFKDRRLIHVEEVDRKGIYPMNARKIKNLVPGKYGGKVSGRNLNSKPEEFRIYGTMLVTCNHVPIIDDPTDTAVLDRIIMFQFKKQFNTDEDTDFGMKGRYLMQLALSVGRDVYQKRYNSIFPRERYPYRTLEDTTDDLTTIYKEFISYYFTKSTKRCHNVRMRDIRAKCDAHNQKIGKEEEAKTLPNEIRKTINFESLWKDYIINYHTVENVNKNNYVTDLKKK